MVFRRRIPTDLDEASAKQHLHNLFHDGKESCVVDPEPPLQHLPDAEQLGKGGAERAPQIQTGKRHRGVDLAAPVRLFSRTDRRAASTRTDVGGVTCGSSLSLPFRRERHLSVKTWISLFSLAVVRLREPRPSATASILLEGKKKRENGSKTAQHAN